ncbi:hypothetical protein CEXT_416981 [Caerostris extrusa]|uniref:Uncharacterized protein n=1 Tax=Caerostris extrusa TaxID=172846 RepID=A0AAV4SGT3_CAEEX|nr:hypothetical protein CEXT_416981 [Caerostris extrusa]
MYNAASEIFFIFSHFSFDIGIEHALYFPALCKRPDVQLASALVTILITLCLTDNQKGNSEVIGSNFARSRHFFWPKNHRLSPQNLFQLDKKTKDVLLLVGHLLLLDAVCLIDVSMKN